ncbi:MAG: hypothetical protein ACLFUH_07100 [Bacteroidales bacterium]
MKNKGTNRRHFIRNLSLALMGTTVFSRKAFSIGSDQLSKESLDNKKIIQYKTLGRTGFKVSDIASGAPKNETVLRALIEKVFEACEKKNIGRAIMKSSPVMIYNILEKAVNRYEEEGKDPGDEYYAYLNRYKERADKAKEFFKDYGAVSDEELVNAAIVYVLSNPAAHTVCLDFNNLDDVERFLSLSGNKLEKKQASLLTDYQNHFGFMNCQIGCNECEKACPHNLPVNYILRYNYYYQTKKEEKEAMKLYSRIPGEKAELCMSCPGYCEEACPNNVSARQLMAMAHQNLSLDMESFA